MLHSVLMCMGDPVCKIVGVHFLEEKYVKLVLQIVLGHENWQSREICKCGHSCKER